MNIGIALSDFGASQKAFEIIVRTNNFLLNQPHRSATGFFENQSSLCFLPEFPVMPLAEIFGFDGPIIANDLKTAETILTINTISPLYYYIWDLEWMFFKNPAYENIRPVYNSKLSLICRSKPHAILLQNLWNVKVRTIEDFDLEKIL